MEVKCSANPQDQLLLVHLADMGFGRPPFQLPVLFYVLTAFAMLTRKADLLFVVLAWVFVVTRLVHAAVHTGPNDLRQRFAACNEPHFRLHHHAQ